MHSIIRLTILFGLFAWILASDVLVFTDSDFEDKVKEHDVILVEFYAPWCGHCKRLAPEYEKAATTLITNDPPIHIAKIDCTVHGATCAKYQITGYPTLKIFRKGEVAEDYDGLQNANAIAGKMRAKAGPAYRILEKVEDYEKFLNNNEHMVIGYFDSDTHSLKEDFVKVAGELTEKFRFAYTTSKDILKKVGQTNKILLHQPKHLQSKIEDTFHVVQVAGDELKTYIENNIHGLVGHRTLSNIADFIKPTVVVYYNVDYTLDPKGTSYTRNRILKLAKKLSDENVNVRFAVCNANDFRQEITQFGISDVKKDGKYVLARGPKGEKYRLTEEFSLETLENFARKYVNNELEAYIKSQDIPEQTEDVKVVVGKNFDDIVNDNTKDVLIEFYAPWCGHCKSLTPKYDELAKTLKNEKSVVIAKMDATENDVPSQYAVRGYPTIYYAPKNDKSNPKKYEGAREVEAFIQFLAKESTDGLDGYDRVGNKKTKANADL